MGLPAMARCTFSSASAAAKMLSSEAPTGTSMVARSLPSTLTARIFSYEVKPSFTVANEAQISAPPAVSFDKPAPAASR